MCISPTKSGASSSWTPRPVRAVFFISSFCCSNLSFLQLLIALAPLLIQTGFQKRWASLHSPGACLAGSCHRQCPGLILGASPPPLELSCQNISVPTIMPNARFHLCLPSAHHFPAPASEREEIFPKLLSPDPPSSDTHDYMQCSFICRNYDGK